MKCAQIMNNRVYVVRNTCYFEVQYVSIYSLSSSGICTYNNNPDLSLSCNKEYKQKVLVNTIRFLYIKYNFYNIDLIKFLFVNQIVDLF